MTPVVYTPASCITAFGLERLHPFDSLKYRRIADWLVRQGVRRRADFVAPRYPTVGELESIHSRDYLRSLGRREVLRGILEVPLPWFVPAWVVDWRVLRPMRWSVGGTVLACRLALEHGLAVHLGGGFHHASGREGGGFCCYADVPLALHLLHREGLVRSVLVIDTDAHQGNGTADAIRDWPWAAILDFFDDTIFPFPKVQEDVAVPLPSGTDGARYHEELERHLPAALDRFRPDLVVHNAGSDVLGTDPLSHLMLTDSEMEARDLYVTTEVRRRGIPLAMVLSGGYGPLSWQAHARSIEAILTRFDAAK